MLVEGKQRGGKREGAIPARALVGRGLPAGVDAGLLVASVRVGFVKPKDTGTCRIVEGSCGRKEVKVGLICRFNLAR